MWSKTWVKTCKKLNNSCKMSKFKKLSSTKSFSSKSSLKLTHSTHSWLNLIVIFRSCVRIWWCKRTTQCRNCKTFNSKNNYWSKALKLHSCQKAHNWKWLKCQDFNNLKFWWESEKESQQSQPHRTWSDRTLKKLMIKTL